MMACHFWSEDKETVGSASGALCRLGSLTALSLGHTGSVWRCHMARNWGPPAAMKVDILDLVEPWGGSSLSFTATSATGVLPHRNCEMMNVCGFWQLSLGGFGYTTIDNKYSHSFALLLPWLGLGLWYSWLFNNSGVRDADPPGSRKAAYNFTGSPLYLRFCVHGFN